jgi:putative transposase
VGWRWIERGAADRGLAHPERARPGEVSAVVLQQAPANLNTAYRNSFASVTGTGRKPAGPVVLISHLIWGW